MYFFIPFNFEINRLLFLMQLFILIVTQFINDKFLFLSLTVKNLILILRFLNQKILYYYYFILSFNPYNHKEKLLLIDFES